MITAVTTCMGRREHLETTLPLMLEEFEQVVVVDWSCPQKSGEWAFSQGAHVVYSPNQQYFHCSAARNLGAFWADGNLLCFIDADTIIIPGTGKEIEELLSDQGMVIASRTANNIDVPNLAGFIAVTARDFKSVGGYNENIEGYAIEDCYLRAQLRLELGLSAKRLGPSALGAIQHSNELRGQFFKEPIEVSVSKNFQILTKYLQKYGISDWKTDPRTSDIAYRNQ